MAGKDYVGDLDLDDLAVAWCDAAALYGHSRRPRQGPGRRALLVLDVQGTFADPASHAWLPVSTWILPRIEALLRSFRKAGEPVCFTRHAVAIGEDPGRMADWWGHPIPEGSPGSRLCLEPLASEPVLRKTRYSAFMGTGLEDLLRAQGVDTLILAGAMTHLCVESTARDAFQRGFHVIVAADATASIDQELHVGALRGLAHGFATILPSRQIIAETSARLPASARESVALPSMADVVVVGAGPAGLAAAVQLTRMDHPPLLLESGKPGGLLRQAWRIENIPGWEPLSGPAAVMRLQEWASSFGVQPQTARVLGAVRLGDGFEVRTDQGMVRTRALLLCTGTRPRPAGFPGEDLSLVFTGVRELLAARPSDDVLVLGGGDAALDQALSLHDAGCRVRILLRGECRALPRLRRLVEARGIPLERGGIQEALPLPVGLGLRLAGHTEMSPQVGSLLLAIGREPALLPGIVAHPGLMMAGDRVCGRYRQAASAMGQGVQAAMAAVGYLEGSC